MKTLVAELLQVVAFCNGYTRAICNNSAFRASLTYETPCLKAAITHPKKRGVIAGFSKVVAACCRFCSSPVFAC
jgi:hypothetical protein